jgi:hypothetical protein
VPNTGLLVQQKAATTVNVKDFGATGNGTADDSAAITAAINALGGLPGRVTFPSGTYVTTLQTLNTGQWLIGVGYEATILLLKASSNTDLIQTTNFATLTGSGQTASPYNWGIESMTLDGNKANNASGGRCISIYGYGWTMRDVRLRNAKSDGMYCEWANSSSSPGNDSMESFMESFKVHDCGGDGIIFKGPHDGVFSHGLIYGCGTGGNHNAHLRIDPSGTGVCNGAIITDVHVWGGTVDYGIINNGDAITLATCFAEGATVAQLWNQNADAMIIGGRYFSGNSGGQVKGIIFGNSGTTNAARTTARGVRVDNCLAGAIDIGSPGVGSLTDNSTLDIQVYNQTGVDTTSSTAITAGSVTITPAAMTNITTSTLLYISGGTGTAEYVTPSAVTGSTLTATFANNHTGTYRISTPLMIGTPTDFNNVLLHVTNVSTPSSDSIMRMLGALRINPGSGTEVPLQVRAYFSGQTANLVELYDTGGTTRTYAVGPTGNVAAGPGAAPNSSILFFGTQRANGDRPFVAIATASPTGNMYSAQTSGFADMWRIDKAGRSSTPGNGSTPTAAAAANAGTSPPAPVVTAGSFDTRGQLTFGTGTTPAAGKQVTVTFTASYAATPMGVVPFAMNAATAALGTPYVLAGDISTTAFTVSFPNAPSASQANTVYAIGWIVEG